MKIGLIIQGPLVSYGKTGKTIVYTPRQLVKSKNSMKNFDCVENVKNILGSSEKTFHETLLVTWEDKNMSSSLNGSNVLILNDEHKFKRKKLHLCQVQEIGIMYLSKQRQPMKGCWHWKN